MRKNDPLTWDRLNEVLEIDASRGIALWKKDLGGRFRAGKIAGDLNHKFGYVIISIDRKKYKRHRLIWFFVHRSWPSSDLDHINGLRQDDRIENLRPASRSQNLWNAALSKSNTSGCKGVSWRREKGKWTANIKAHGILYNLGMYEDIEDAIAARKSAEQRLHQGFIRNDNYTVSYPASNTGRRARNLAAVPPGASGERNVHPRPGESDELHGPGTAPGTDTQL